jgi:hypothetical protein
MHRGGLVRAGVQLCADCEALRVYCNRIGRFQGTYGGLGVLGSGLGDTGGGSQGSIAPKGVAVCLQVMASFCATDPKYNMFIDLGFGDGRMLVYARAKFHYLRGTEIGGELQTSLSRIQQWMRCVSLVGPYTAPDIALYRHERSIDRPVGLSGPCHVAVWHFHQGWREADIARVRGWLVRFNVAVYVSVCPGYGGFVIDGFVHLLSVTVKMTGQHGQSCARVCVREDLVYRGA